MLAVEFPLGAKAVTIATNMAGRGLRNPSGCWVLLGLVLILRSFVGAFGVFGSPNFQPGEL